MARLHILASGRCVLHEPVPATNNTAGISWRTALVNSGMGGTSSLPIGTGPGQITTAELAQIAAGELMEIAFVVELQTGMNAAQRNAAMMDAQIATISAETQARIARDLRFFGLTRG